jgi:hypothetical protein
LQTFRHGKQALHFKGKASASSLLTLPSKLTINDGLRFSYFRTSGDLEVRLLSLTGQVLAAVDVRNAKASKANTPALQAKHCAQQNRWASCVLLPNKALKKQLSPAKKGAKAIPFRIAFLPKGQGEWQIDRIQSVRKAKGISLTAVAFDRYISGFGAIFVSFAGFLFAFSTLISWSYYGETGIAYAFGKASVLPYRLIFLVFAFIGAVQSLELVVSFSDALVGLLVIPNMIALIALSGKVSQWTKEYFDDLKSGKIKRTK